jgi:hypothetical protein
MTALSSDRPNISAHANGWEFVREQYPGDSGQTFYQGSAVGRDPADSGNVKALAAAKPYYRVIGVNGAYLVGNGTKKVKAAAGLCERENSSSGDEVLSTLPLGWPLYAVDDATVSLTDGSGTRTFLGVFGGMSRAGKPLVWIGCDPFGLAMSLIKWPVVFGFADVVTAGGAALTADLNFGPVLPGPCRVMGFSTDALTVFSGGSVATCTFSLGTSAGGTQIHTALDIFTGAAAAPKKGTAGSLGYNCAPLAAGVQIQGRVTTTTANVDALTAGAYVGSIILKPGS